MSTGLRFTLEVDGLPPDAFAVVSFHLNQSLSSLFSLDLSLVSQQFLSLEFAQVLDKMAYLTIWQGDEVQRRVKGVVTWFELGENDKNQMLYSMTRTEVSTLCISQFRYSAQIRPSSVVTKDYTFKRPGWAGRFDQEGQHQDYQRTQYEVYDYPGRFKGAHGQNFARWQMDGWRNNAETARGMSRSPEIWPGRRIVLTGHPQANLNREWQVVASELHGEQPQAVPGRQGAGTALENHFAVIPADRTWRPQP
ncbi:contractile injection system protein, VgrG/Pvc8 family, partial [Escherichia coli]